MSNKELNGSTLAPGSREDLTSEPSPPPILVNGDSLSVGTAPASQERDGSSQSLSDAVRTSLDQFFEHLNGSDPDNLYRIVIDEVERPLLERVLAYYGGNQTRASQCLGISRGTLRKKLRLHGLASE